MDLQLLSRAIGSFSPMLAQPSTLASTLGIVFVSPVFNHGPGDTIRDHEAHKQYPMWMDYKPLTYHSDYLIGPKL